LKWGLSFVYGIRPLADIKTRVNRQLNSLRRYYPLFGYLSFGGEPILNSNTGWVSLHLWGPCSTGAKAAKKLKGHTMQRLSIYYLPSHFFLVRQLHFRSLTVLLMDLTLFDFFSFAGVLPASLSLPLAY